MAFRIRNSYKTHLMDLNMMDLGIHKKFRINPVEILFFIIPVVTIAAIFLVSGLEDLSFYAQCQNVHGGDICYISMK